MGVKLKSIIGLALLVMCFGCLAFTPRLAFFKMLGLIGVSFGLYALLFNSMKRWSLVWGITACILVRLVFFFELPMLSDDFYRFIWDGMLFSEGFVSIGNIPSSIDISSLPNPEWAGMLREKMNSPNYPSIYPPLHQLISGGAYIFGGESLLGGVNALRMFILTAEVLFLIYVFFRAKSMFRYALFYVMNPLVIIEGLGNVHIEALMVPVLGIALISTIRHNYIGAGVAWGSTILVKLIPIILAPVFFFRLNWKSRWKFVLASIAVVAGVLIVSSPVETFKSVQSALGIYYGYFEFNASVYYVLRSLLMPVFGYNPIGVLAPWLAAFAFVCILWVSYIKRKASLMELALVVYLIYLLTSAVVHPWYLLPVVLLSVFSGRYYLLIWSALVFVSYAHYVGEVGPKWFWISIEYLGLGAALIAESKKERWLQSAFRG